MKTRSTKAQQISFRINLDNCTTQSTNSTWFQTSAKSAVSEAD